MTGTRAQLAGLAAARAALEMGRATPTRPTRLVYQTDRGAISVPIHTDLAAAHRHLMATIDASDIARDDAGVPDGVWYCQPDRYR